MTGSDARREAEPVLMRPWAEPRVVAVGELGIASLLRTDAAAGVGYAQSRADELLAAARREGRELVAAARESARDAALAYAAAYRAALDAGWSAAELERMGYSPGAEADQPAGEGYQPVGEGDQPAGDGDGAAGERDGPAGEPPGRVTARRRQPASDTPAVGDAAAPPRLSFSGHPGTRPSWRPISPRSRAEDPEPR